MSVLSICSLELIKEEYVNVDDYVKYTNVYSKIACDKCVSTKSQDFFFYSKVNIWKENKSTRLFLNNLFLSTPNL